MARVIVGVGEGQRGRASLAAVVGRSGEGHDAVGGKRVARHRQPFVTVGGGLSANTDDHLLGFRPAAADAHGDALVAGAPGEGHVPVLCPHNGSDPRPRFGERDVAIIAAGAKREDEQQQQAFLHHSSLNYSSVNGTLNQKSDWGFTSSSKVGLNSPFMMPRYFSIPRLRYFSMK